MDRIIIVGAGWAGLSAAIKLSQQNRQVVLLERAPQAGGRARKISYKGYTLDNGQHLMIGAYDCMLHTMRSINMQVEDFFVQEAFNFQIFAERELKLSITTRKNSKQHTLYALLRTFGFSFREKVNFFKTIIYWLKLALQKKQKFISVRNFLNKINASSKSCKYFWEPLCLAALSTPADKASSKIFANVLKKAFTGNISNCNYLFNNQDLHTTFPKQAIEYLQNHGVETHFNTNVKSINFQSDSFALLNTNKGEIVGSTVIIASNIQDTQRLLKDVPWADIAMNKLTQLKPVPITTIYLIAVEKFKLPNLLTGIVDGVGHWVFDRRFCGQDNIISIVITGNIPECSTDTLVQSLLDELKIYFPKLPKIIDYKVIKEKQAAFLCDEQAEVNRPKTKLNRNSYLIGDYIDTGLPASLESAMLSGQQVAEVICKPTISPPNYV